MLTLGYCSLYGQLRASWSVDCLQGLTSAWDAGPVDASPDRWAASVEWLQEALDLVESARSEVMATPAQIELHLRVTTPDGEQPKDTRAGSKGCRLSVGRAVLRLVR